ncbi:MAG TPA: c-type cytochrome, partial [Myxococcales bacterium]|nr:c-type cytochrome [Myxococcales bacterium]
MKNFLQIAAFTLIVSLTYTGIAFLLPQLESRPAPQVKLGAKIGPEKLAPVGQLVFENICLQCHKLGESGRAPDLANIGQGAEDRAAERGPGFTAVDYLVESLCKPGDYLVEGFGNIMPPQQKALDGGQILAVVAYLQTLGGEATVKGTDVEPIIRFGCITGSGPGSVATNEAAAPEKLGSPDKVYEKFGCSGCHAIDDDTRKIGPSLYDVGKRLKKGEIYESILAPDKVIAKGDPPFAGGTMIKTLDG